MSHELRAPLNAVIGFADLFRMEACGPLGDACYREYAEDIRAGGAHLLRVINAILGIASMNSGGIALREEDIDVTAKFARVVRIMLPDATKASVHLDFRIEANLPQLRADRQKLWQMLINLIFNAIKFTPAGGEVLVLAGMHEDGMAITVKDAGIAQI
jgi:two-component system cell cycle sensor histidine kinase PleC